MLRTERQSAQMSKITNDCLTRSGTGCFTAVPIWQQWASKVNYSVAGFSNQFWGYVWIKHFTTFIHIAILSLYVVWYCAIIFVCMMARVPLAHM